MHIVAIAGTTFALAVPLVAQSREPDPPTSLRFEVASIKRNVSGEAGVPFQILPNGEIRVQNTPVLGLIQRAYAGDNGRREFIGLPSWVQDERYDVVAKGKAGATADEMRQMWRALLADRFKLVTHFEPKEVPSFDLVLARTDGRLGPGLTPSPLDCTQPALSSAATAPAGSDPSAFVMTRCNTFGIGKDDTVAGGGVTIPVLARFISPLAGRPIIDRTGLTGVYSVKLRVQRVPQRADAVPGPDDPPSVFTAVPEQLGLKFESSKTTVQALAIDHIERPDPD